METTMLKPGSVQALMQLIRRMFLEINTAIPGEVISFDAELQTVTAKPCIKGTVINNRGQAEFVELPQIIQVPVYFPFSTGSKFSLTYPVTPGDQCLLVFSQRSFDNWLAFGSVQIPSEPGIPRSHQYSDALAIIGFAPNPSVIKDFQLSGIGNCQYNGIEIRNDTRNSYVKVMDEEVRIHEGKADIDLHTDGTIELSIQSSASPDDGLESESGVTYLKIAPDGTTTLLTPNNLNVSSKNVSILSQQISVQTNTANVTATSTANVTSPTSTFNGNVSINGNLAVTGDTLSSTYSVGSGGSVRPGISGGPKEAKFQSGIAIE